MKDRIKYFGEGILFSYSQIFFSDSRLFSFLLLFVSFADFYAGLAGLISVILTNALALAMGLDRRPVGKGVFGFNSLLVGLCLGISFSPGLVLYVVISLSAVLTLFITLSLKGILGKYGLPFLSLPFLVGAWVLTLATKNMEFLGISERGIFVLNDLYTLGGHEIVRLYEWWNSLEITRPLKIYFISLGAILFQYNVLSGIVISAGLLYCSRISFTLSLLGFFTAYLFYYFVGADISELSYSYIGFNYILTSIAVGGFFIIPSVRSYLWSVLIVPIGAILTLSFSSVFTALDLPMYSLPFNIMVILFLYALKFRVRLSGKLSEVTVQQNSPEKNLYSFQNYMQRFRPSILPLKLPFYGVWSVNQGYEGEHTHIGDWRHALDFVILGNGGKQFSGDGNVPEDYYCFNKPLIAPADGYVEFVVNNVEDNQIGKVNIKENWGNTVIIRHNNYLFTSLSHLKKGSVTVKAGDKVRQGEILGRCGNSGRSPYPHLHFQVQSSQFIGSPTIEYPLGYYIEHNEKSYSLKNYSIPAKGDSISNVENNEVLARSFDLIPGKSMRFEVSRNGQALSEQWEIGTNEFNQQYIKCSDGRALAYFSNDGSLFLIYHYEGPKSTLLYYFSLAAFRIQLGFYRDLELTDTYPLNLTFRSSALFIQDFIAPFWRFMDPEYRIRYEYIDNEVYTGKIRLAASSVNKVAGFVTRRILADIEFDENGLSGIAVNGNGTKLTAKKCSE
ncbi:MAG: urea transporter [Bacteroidales bacterium]|nr:urea transporter [Bacteroidales bacterium]